MHIKFARQYNAVYVTATDIPLATAIPLNSAGTFAFISENITHIIKKCRINSTGELIDCVASSDFPATEHLGITLNSSNTFIYVSNSVTPSAVSQCRIANEQFDLIDCDIAVNLTAPGGIALLASPALAYIANTTNIQSCIVNTNGNLTNCTTVTSGLESAVDIAINAQKTIAYIAESGSYFSG